MSRAELLKQADEAYPHRDKGLDAWSASGYRQYLFTYRKVEEDGKVYLRPLATFQYLVRAA
jgi:hypothetical protein